jgi:NADPH:quinone reductase-like Zn-dependent oxidoreductase
MRAAVVTRFGRRWAVELRDMPQPAPGPGELLVRVRAATVNRSDMGELRHPVLQRLITLGQAGRRILGMDFAGEVEAIGPGVAAFAPGDRVFGLAPFSGDGAQADYFRMAATGPIAILPADIPFGEAPVCEGAYYANASLSRFDIGPAHRILVFGASGAIGTAAVQLARHRGAEVVAAVLPRHLDMARNLGASRVVACDSAEFRELGPSFDLVLDAIGKMRARQWRPLLKPDGVFATTDAGPRGQSLLLLLWSLVTRSGRVTIPVPKRGSAPGFVGSLAELMEAGAFRAVIDSTYPLEAIANAYARVETGEKAGIVIVDLDSR